jgi:hypothetical protein
MSRSDPVICGTSGIIGCDQQRGGDRDDVVTDLASASGEAAQDESIAEDG